MANVINWQTVIYDSLFTQQSKLTCQMHYVVWRTNSQNEDKKANFVYKNLDY